MSVKKKKIAHKEEDENKLLYNLLYENVNLKIVEKINNKILGHNLNVHLQALAHGDTKDTDFGVLRKFFNEKGELPW